jgi:signal transduction histidine kinase
VAEIQTESFPWWFRDPRRLDRVALLLAVAPALLGSIVLLVADTRALEVVPAIIALAGVAISRRAPRLAPFVVALAPLITLVLHVDSTFAWTLPILASPLFVLRGPSPGLAHLPGFDGITFAASILLVIAAVATTAALQKQIGYLRAMQEEAQRALEARDREAERSIIEECLRIARDLHDVVGHQVALVSVQLSLAEVHATRDEAKTRQALVEARRGIQSILHEMQRILEVLRFAEGDDAKRPTGDVRALPGLIASFRRVGMSVDAELATIEGRLDAAVDTAVYRVTQESLTNAQRYGSGTVRVALRQDGDVVELRVENRVAAGPRAGGSGFGLVGMRERVQSAGGSLAVSNGDDRFTVVARMRTTGEQL